MTLHPIKVAFDSLEPSILNTAAHYPEGRNILIYCLTKKARRTEGEVLRWLDEEKIPIYKLDEYRIRDDSD